MHRWQRQHLSYNLSVASFMCACVYVCLRVCLGKTHLREGGALHVFDCFEVSGQLLGRLRGDGLLLVLGQLLDSGGVVPQINLRSHQQERGLWTVVGDLWDPLESETEKYNR